jgi:16S rRNA (uracil1498-N3)-methyltransferase
MRHRIHIDALAPTVTVSGDEFHHSVRVVRVREGEEVEVFDDAGKLARGTVASIAKDSAVIDIIEELPSRESKLQLTLAMSIIQLEKFELVLQKATELGVSAIVPLVTERIELRKERYAGKMERWNRILFEAVKQSGRSIVPKFEEPQRFADVMARPGSKVLFDADREASPWPSSLDEVTVFIGPEGGWSDEELEAAQRQECLFERIGPRRLRAETAAIVACTVIAARYGDI